MKENINKIQPTQLYISDNKLDKATRYLEKLDYQNYKPIPVKKIGSLLFFTDGHTRALALFNHGISEIDIIIDEDELDWVAYLADIKLCKDNKIFSISDLNKKIIPHFEYKQKWLDLCQEIQKDVKNSPLRTLQFSIEHEPKIKSEICDNVLNSLPEWFGLPDSTKAYIEAVKVLTFIRVELFDSVIGFCAVKENYSVNADLYVLGIYKEFHRKGIGERLIQFIEEKYSKEKFKYLSVKTLSENSTDKNYAKTRKFYEKCGFIAFEEFPELWDPTNPCLLMVKSI